MREELTFRKKPSFFPKKVSLLPNSTPPTSEYRESYSRIEDYWLKVSITPVRAFPAY